MQINMLSPIPVAVLEATGKISQRFAQLLVIIPWFWLTAVVCSDRTVGFPYSEACRWELIEPIAESARKLTILPTDPVQVNFPLAFSTLPIDLAHSVEPQFTATGILVFSNPSASRLIEDVPLLIPEVNQEHSGLLDIQRQKRGWPGGIVTKSNYTSTDLTVAIKALQQAYGQRIAFVVSWQALADAGYSGVVSLEVMDNFVLYINGEEEKAEWEPRKILGQFQNDRIAIDDRAISSHTNRVSVRDGHLVYVILKFNRPVSTIESVQGFPNFQVTLLVRDLPSTPHSPILVLSEPDRPQPHIDRWTGSGIKTIVRRACTAALFHKDVAVQSYNTVRGAASGSIYNAELLLSQGYLSGV